jgi:hypothetical protein
MAKVRKCLDIMESRLPEPKEKGNKKRKKSMEKPKPATVKVAVVAPLVDDPQRKRKRGRPPKNRQLTPPKPDPKDLLMDNLDSPAEVMPRRGSSTRPGQTKGIKKEASITDLISKFEEQYKEMGKHYVAMGETLSRLKSKLGEEQTEREQKIRSELLAEVQKKIVRN